MRVRLIGHLWGSASLRGLAVVWIAVAACCVHAAQNDPDDRRTYQPVERPPVPTVDDDAWNRNPIDAFVKARLSANGLDPAPPAPRRQLIRRVYYDLIGLPPTPRQVRDFVNDKSPDAYEKLVDKLLASKHYGEQWGRHWLDLVRWAQTNGYERDGDKPNAWRYRDYVIESFNEDKPYDQFIREQLAGDELDEVTPETIIATGCYRLGIWDDEPADREQALFDGFDDLVATTSQVMLGMTLNCARCHDHKVDPMTQKDYYSFVAFFRNIRPFSHSRNVHSHFSQTVIATDAQRAEHERVKAEKVAAIQRQIDELEKIVEATFEGVENDDAKTPEVRAELIKQKLDTALNDEQLKRYKELQKRLNRVSMPPLPSALSVTEFGSDPKPTHVLMRGSVKAPGDRVKPDYPEVFGQPAPTIPEPAAGDDTTGRRRVLAEWITSPDNPRTARVMVNRIWQYHFGRGIVRTPNDWGALGQAPTHPKLLDWLAAEFVERGWSIKSMHRLILHSKTYRMSSRDDEAALAKDPANDLMWRFDMRRLTAEQVRDSMLAVSGQLNLQTGGPSIYPEMPQAVLATSSKPNQAWGKSPPDQQNRRSVYIYLKRSLVEHVLSTFDAADTDNTCPVRFATTVPTQALTALNGDFTQKQAAALVQRLKDEAGNDPPAQVRRALWLVMQREPSDEDVNRGLNLIDTLVTQHGMHPDRALKAFCLMALNLNEFIYLD